MTRTCYRYNRFTIIGPEKMIEPNLVKYIYIYYLYRYIYLFIYARVSLYVYANMYNYYSYDFKAPIRAR